MQLLLFVQCSPGPFLSRAGFLLLHWDCCHIGCSSQHNNTSFLIVGEYLPRKNCLHLKLVLHGAIFFSNLQQIKYWVKYRKLQGGWYTINMYSCNLQQITYLQFTWSASAFFMERMEKSDWLIRKLACCKLLEGCYTYSNLQKQSQVAAKSRTGFYFFSNLQHSEISEIASCSRVLHGAKFEQLATRANFVASCWKNCVV